MKNTYIIYRIVDGKVLLFVNHRCHWSGYVSDKIHSGISEVGSLTIFEGKGVEVPSEKVVFCRLDSFIELVPHPSHRLVGPTSFSVEALPIEEMGIMQKSIINSVVESRSFTGLVRFLDKKRSIATEINIVHNAPF